MFARHLSLITQRDSQPGRHPVTLRSRRQGAPTPPATANPQAGRFAALTERQWGYSPELNPDEWVWNNVKNTRLGRVVSHDRDDLKSKAIGALRR